MAQIQTVRLVDDLSGSEAEETVSFALDGKQFEIDLSTGNASSLRDKLAPFVSAARSSASSPGAGRRAARAARSARGSNNNTPVRQHNQAVRAWARQNGYTVSGRGRIPAEVVAAYEGANTSSAAEPSGKVQFSG